MERNEQYECEKAFRLEREEKQPEGMEVSPLSLISQKRGKQRKNEKKWL